MYIRTAWDVFCMHSVAHIHLVAVLCAQIAPFVFPSCFVASCSVMEMFAINNSYIRYDKCW